MNNLPTNHDPHPAWCSPERCEVLPGRNGLGDHRSEVTTLTSSERFHVKVSVWLSQYAYESPTTAPVFVMVQVDDVNAGGELEQRATHEMRLRPAAHLAEVLAELATLGEVAS